MYTKGLGGAPETGGELGTSGVMTVFRTVVAVGHLCEKLLS